MQTLFYFFSLKNLSKYGGGGYLIKRGLLVVFSLYALKISLFPKTERKWTIVKLKSFRQNWKESAFLGSILFQTAIPWGSALRKNGPKNATTVIFCEYVKLTCAIESIIAHFTLFNTERVHERNLHSR